MNAATFTRECAVGRLYILAMASLGHKRSDTYEPAMTCAALCDEHDRADDERAGAPVADIYTSGAISTTVTSAARCASCGRTPVRGAALRALDALSRLRDRAYARQLPTCYG